MQPSRNDKFSPFSILTAGSKLEQVISEGSEALNAYIDSGQIEELSDLIPGSKSDDSDAEDSSEEPEKKRSKSIKNHNAQVIFKNLDSNTTIPSLMTINVPPVPDGSQPMNSDNWNNTNFNAAPPPSLLNLNVAPPFDDSASNWAGRNEFNNRNNSKPEGTKRRNRDSDGNRISRFDRESRPSRFDNNNDNSNSSTRNVRRNTRRI